MIKHKELAKICMESYKCLTLRVDGCEMLIRFKDGVTIIAFRGTDTFSIFHGSGIKDIIRDARILPWYDRDVGWAHRGFLLGGQKSAAILQDHLAKDMPLILTGHSLGGAVSLICALKLQAMGFYVKGWVGFGTPRCIFSKTDKFDQVNYRYRSDIVPLMPFFNVFRHRYPVIHLQPNPNRAATWKDHDLQLYYNVL